MICPDIGGVILQFSTRSAVHFCTRQKRNSANLWKQNLFHSPQVLRDLVETLRTPDHIHDIVKGDGEKGLELVGQRPNPYLDRDSDQ